jgi:hypothetical protein
MVETQLKQSADEMLAEDMGRFYDDPLGFVMYAYDWDNDQSLQIVELVEPWATKYKLKYGPDKWACEFLDELAEKIKDRKFDGSNAVEPIREAISSGHGIGKSAMVGWLVDFLMSTRPFTRGIVTANTAPQLETKTWAQVASWTKRCITGHWFNISTGKGSMKMVHKDYPESWRCDAQTCKEENSEAFAGQHAANSTSFYIFDEGSAVPDKIYEVAEGGLTDGEPMMFVFGNPTRNTGSFKDCFGKLRHRWDTRQIDSRTVKITNKTLIQQWIDDYGINSDFVKVRVLGQFPSASSKQFIPQDLVDKARQRVIPERLVSHAAKIITLDPAWSGDDEYVIGFRQGLSFKVLWTGYQIEDDIWLADKLAYFEDDLKADAVFIDFGYGTGIHSVGKSWGRKWQLVSFGAGSNNPAYLNKRGEMWGNIKTWLAEGGAIDAADQILADDLIGPEYSVRLDGKIVLESKDDMKRRGIASPNRADALGLSFAFPVTPTGINGKFGKGILSSEKIIADYNPYDSTI